MSKSILSSLSIATIACGAMLALELSPASAFTLYGTSAKPLTTGQFDRVYYRAYRGGYAYRGRYGYRGGYGYRGAYGYRGYGYRGGYGYHPYGYGYHPYGYGYGYGYHPYGYGYGAAAVGAAVAAHHCWINSYGYRVCN
jgi:hypothetical protein